MNDSLREKMIQQISAKGLFDQARDGATDYLNGMWDRPVYPTDEAIAALAHFDEPMPQQTGDGSAILTQLIRDGAPATLPYSNGRYFGFVTGGVVPTGLAARMLSDAWDQGSALHVMSPISAKMEQVCQAWIKELLGLPEETVAGFVSGSSVAIYCALAAGRERIYRNLNWDVNAKGLNEAPRIRIVATDQTHGTVKKAIALLGLGLDNVEWVETDDQGRILVSALPELDKSCLVILQAGNVNSGSFDPFEEICDRANGVGAWVHIDGAFGLWAAACKSLCHLTKGMEKAHSWSVDGHKTLNTPYDNGIVLCRDEEALVKALQASGSYIAYGENRDGMMYTPEMSRRARAIELWATLKYLGRDGVDEMVTGFQQRAAQFGAEMADAGFRVLNDVVFNQVMVATEHEELTQRTMERVQASGECWAGGAVWQGEAIIRISVCGWATSEADVTRSVQAFVAARAQAKKDLNRE